MASNGTKRRAISRAQELIRNTQRESPIMQKKLFCLRLYTEWLDGLSKQHLDQIVNQLIKQGHDFRPGKE